MLAALLGALGALTAGRPWCCWSAAADVWAWVLAGVAGVAWMLRSRSYVGTEQRIAAVCTGLVLVVFGAPAAGRERRLARCRRSGRASPPSSAPCWSSTPTGCVVRARSPYWGRFFDVVEFVSLLAIIPLAGQVLRLYTDLRAAVS